MGQAKRKALTKLRNEYNEYKKQVKLTKSDLRFINEQLDDLRKNYVGKRITDVSVEHMLHGVSKDSTVTIIMEPVKDAGWQGGMKACYLEVSFNDLLNGGLGVTGFPEK
jgi:phenylpyruvate tautomerase PptA (4-oxalocrotonate tautomerase family)